MSLKTTKSFKESRRDKPKHSLKDHQVTKKGGAGGRGTWGNPKDDEKYIDEDIHAIDDRDPNYDPVDQQEDGYVLRLYKPSDQRKKFFANTIDDLSRFKTMVRSACEEYLISYDTDECIASIKDMEFSLYHQDLPAILVKYSLDKSDKDRSKISQLMHALSKENVITTLQMAQGFRKLYQNLDELALDAPNAKVIMTEFTNHAVAAGYLDSSVQSEVENDTAYLGDVETLKKVKKDIDECLQEYMSSNVIDELLESAKSVPPAMHFELVKRLVYVALDRTDVERERANVGLAALVGDVISSDSAQRGMSVMLSRVEDLVLDVPEVLRLLSCFLARSITDEALPPSFLLRLDLSKADMGFQVAELAQELLAVDNAAAKMARVWGVVDDDEDD